MIKIVEVLEINGEKYVRLEDYQQLMRQCEALQPHCSNAEIIAQAGEDEVCDE